MQLIGQILAFHGNTFKEQLRMKRLHLPHKNWIIIAACFMAPAHLFSDPVISHAGFRVSGSL